ncbi:hypothetical protein NC652_021338 [Populus alba x Populus x berolinensis]|nr:hypothetical protein NC652_021338 [Populus alba x Populus x berolinensis]
MIVLLPIIPPPHVTLPATSRRCHFSISKLAKGVLRDEWISGRGAKVHDCELDRYGAVNNAVYASRHGLLERIGIGAEARNRYALALSNSQPAKKWRQGSLVPLLLAYTLNTSSSDCQRQSLSWKQKQWLSGLTEIIVRCVPPELGFTIDPRISRRASPKKQKDDGGQRIITHRITSSRPRRPRDHKWELVFLGRNDVKGTLIFVVNSTARTHQHSSGARQ